MIKSLTSLRGIFILFIFFHHCLNIYPGGGSMAVTFFFVLGGFSMTLGYKDKVLKPEFSYKQYIIRRCIKFYPLHWICLLACLPLVGIVTIKQGGVFVLNAALMQTLVPIKRLFFSYNAVSWYLADTLFFAVVFPPLIRWILRLTIKGRIGISILLVAVYIIVAVLLPVEWYHGVLYISPYIRLFDFVFGIYLALGYLKLKGNANNRMFKNEIINTIIIIGVILLLVLESCWLTKPLFFIAPFYWPLVALVIIMASLITGNGRGRFIENKYLLTLGELSFTIFLIHQLVLRYTSEIFEKIQIVQPIIYVVFTLIFTLIVSYVLNKYILNPISKWLTKKIQPSMTALS